MRKDTRAHRLVTASTILAAGCVMLLPTPAIAAPGTPSNPAGVSGAAFQIIDAKTGKCATVAGGTSHDNNVPLVQFNCDTDSSRRWALSHWNGESYQLVNVKTHKCATIAGGVSTENNLPLVQFNCDSDLSRRWMVTNWNGSSYQLVDAQTGKCATVAGGTSHDNNVPLVQFNCDTDLSRRWSLRLAG
ncbi:Ricin B lectin [Streptomyces sp. NRRL B-1568]|nr:Ricin B lectin [Streptomyces sp. NRRL B-1568]